MWVIPEVTPEFTSRMEEVLDLYQKPLNPEEPVVCLDERPVVLRGEVRLPKHEGEPGQIKKRDSEYVRCGTANIFCAVEPKAGKHITKTTKRRRGRDFAQMLSKIRLEYPKAKTIHLVMDNLSTHTLKSCTDFYGQERGRALWEGFTPHFTPKHASWLNQAEIEISMMSREALGKDRFPNCWHLRIRVNAWSQRINHEARTIAWKFTTAKARKKLRYGYGPNRRSGPAATRSSLSSTSTRPGD
jgi:transposase